VPLLAASSLSSRRNRVRMSGLPPMRSLARIIHEGPAAGWSRRTSGAVFRGVGDAGDLGWRLRRGVYSGARGPIAYGGSLAIWPARLAKPA